VNTSLAVERPVRSAQRVPARTVTRAPSEEIELVVQLAHDIRSPLSGILMLTESLRDGAGGSVSESQRRLLDLIHGAALSLCVSASDVVELALDGQGSVNEPNSEFSVADVLRAVLDMASPLAVGRGLELRVAGPTNDRRRGRPRALTRVLLNLTTNALKCTEHGSVEISAREVAGRRDRLEFSVRDSGPGMEAAVMSALDHPRDDAGGARRNSLSSAGMGLSICRKMMLQMGSSLHFETSAREGTRFYFELFAPGV